jgi:DNA-binding response OmpR family regulator
MSDSAESSKVAGMVVDTSRDGSPGASDRAPGCCALIVEDDESLRTLLAHYLRGEGFAVEEVADGEAALRAIERRQAASDLPGVVLLDLMLPHVSGLAVLQYLRAAGVAVPIVVMSVNDALLTSAAAADPECLLIKPFDLDQLLPVVTRYCALPAAAAPPE